MLYIAKGFDREYAFFVVFLSYITNIKQKNPNKRTTCFIENKREPFTCLKSSIPSNLQITVIALSNCKREAISSIKLS